MILITKAKSKSKSNSEITGLILSIHTLWKSISFVDQTLESKNNVPLISF